MWNKRLLCGWGAILLSWEYWFGIANWSFKQSVRDAAVENLLCDWAAFFISIHLKGWYECKTIFMEASAFYFFALQVAQFIAHIHSIL